MWRLALPLALITTAAIAHEGPPGHEHPPESPAYEYKPPQIPPSSPKEEKRPYPAPRVQHAEGEREEVQPQRAERDPRWSRYQVVYVRQIDGVDHQISVRNYQTIHQMAKGIVSEMSLAVKQITLFDDRGVVGTEVFR